MSSAKINKTMSNLDHASLRRNASLEIEELVNKNSSTFLDAVLLWCDNNEIDYIDAKKYIAPALYQKLYDECMKQNMIVDKRTSASINEFF